MDQWRGAAPIKSIIEGFQGANSQVTSGCNDGASTLINEFMEFELYGQSVGRASHLRVGNCTYLPVLQSKMEQYLPIADFGKQYRFDRVARLHVRVTARKMKPPGGTRSLEQD